MRRLRQHAAALAASLLLAASASAYVFIGYRWPDGDLPLRLQLGKPPAPLLDGATDWADVAESAIAEWNRQQSRLAFTPVRDSTSPFASGNGINQLAFRPDLFGMYLDARVLAITVGFVSPSTGRAIEQDVIFNSNASWNSYRGSPRSGTYDLRRITLHELGHVLGLDHPDQASPVQVVDAIMNSAPGAVDALKSDDIAGVRALYQAIPSDGPPVVLADAHNRFQLQGDTFTAGATIGGAEPMTYSWTFQAEDSETPEPFPLATGPSYTIGSVYPTDAGIYTLTARNAFGSATARPVTLRILGTSPTYETSLANISTRGVVGTGGDVLIAGIVISGTEPKSVLLRAAGPSLGSFGVGGALADPILTLVNQAGVTVARNDNWEDEGRGPQLAAACSSVGAFQFRSGSRDAALLATLPPGSYTAIVSGAAASTGVALVEVYETDAVRPYNTTRRLINIATRGRVGPGENNLIAGLVVSGPGPRTYLIRGVGPTLATPPFNVGDPLANPVIQVFKGEMLLRESDDWDAPRSTQDSLRSAADRAGAFPLQSGRDAALLISLPPGSYTARLAGVGGGSGVGLIEVYELR